ncbi:uncharacterized protein TNCV_1460051 [Trichonephila clavipes]|nr:uncharacterized protein TNCV_1460051 [Trichonephila clavipes]
MTVFCKQSTTSGNGSKKKNSEEVMEQNGVHHHDLEIDRFLSKRIPAQLACAYLKGHLKGRALDWFEVLGYRVIEDKTTDYAHLKQALSEQFPVVRNRSELETRFYSSSQRRDQQPSDFIYELLKIHKILKLEMSEEKLIDHVISRLEPQILDYVEVRHPRNTANLLQIVDKYEERFMHRQIRVVLTRKNNDLPPDSPEAYRFAIDYRKLNAITKYPRYPLPVIDDLLTNIPHTNVMSTLDLRSGYFQLAISPKDIEKKQRLSLAIFAFLRMPFGLSRRRPNFQKSYRYNPPTCYWAFRVRLYG